MLPEALCDGLRGNIRGKGVDTLKATGYQCEKCGMTFEQWEECRAEEHESNCGTLLKFQCDKCGEVIEYSDDVYSDNYSEREECHRIDLGRPGYGSGLDGCDVEFNLCDGCLIELINGLTWESKAKVYNSGSSCYSSNKDWIRVHRDGVSWETIEKEQED
jgi:hypothetical protein